MTWRRINAQTDQFIFADKMHPDRTGGGVLYYDVKKSQYVNMGVAGPYGWGVSQASGGPTAMKLQWRDTYPQDRNPGGATVTYANRMMTTHATWSRAGKNVSQDETCTKS